MEATIGLVAVSDRASAGVYRDEGIPSLRSWLGRALRSPWQAVERLVPDEQEQISSLLIELVDKRGCDLVLTTGGTGPAVRDVTPEATSAVIDRLMPGFGELMRASSLKYTPTAILARQVAGTRGRALIINLPGRPKAIAQTLDEIFPAVPYCLDLLGGPRMETDERVVVAYRPAPR